jgi:hypothetical protein
MLRAVEFVQELYDLALRSRPRTRRQAEEDRRRSGERLERFRWGIYVVIGAGVLMLVVALVAVLLTP